MKYKVLVSAPYFQPVVGEFSSIFDANNIQPVVPKVDERLSEEQLLGIIEDIDGVIAGDDQFTAKVLERAKKLKVISKWGTGIDSFDQEAAAERGIAIRNTRGAFNEPVGDQVLGCMLAFSRNIPWTMQDMKNGLWSKRQGFSLQGKTLGIIGVGDTGKAVARRAKAFDMHLLGCDIQEISTDFIREYGIEMVSLNALLSQSDFVSTNCDLNKTSFHLMDYNAFSCMKNTAYFINVGRGPVVDESALISALIEKKIAGAALDVFEDEPLPDFSPLRKMENVILSPHNANSSPEHWQRIHTATLNNLIEELHR